MDLSAESDVSVFSIPLLPFERQLLSDVRSRIERRFASRPKASDSIPNVFENWECSINIREKFLPVLRKKAFRNESIDNTYYTFLTISAYSRAESIIRENQDFARNLTGHLVNNISVSFLKEDLLYWEILATIYDTIPVHWIQDFRNQITTEWASSLGFDTKKTPFHILQLIRVFSILYNAPQNPIIIDQELINSSSFNEVYEVTTSKANTVSKNIKTGIDLSLSEVTALDIINKNATRPKDRPNVETTALYYTMLQMPEFAPPTSLGDPRYYVHFIPWEDLEMTNIDFLRDRGVNVEIPFIKHDSETKWVLWEPKNASLAWNHHLHISDEVFDYNIANNWPFPDHFLGNKVVFHVGAMDRFDFLEGLMQYWDFWNDCAITKQRGYDPILLLQTIPGMRLRSRKQHIDKLQARTYFINLVNAHSSGTLNSQELFQALGLGPGHKLVFEHSLCLIPRDQLDDIIWDPPLGAGSNGAVYKAIWRRPMSYNESVFSDGQPMLVVLKDVVDRSGSSEPYSSRRKLLRELDRTFASLSGTAHSCVNFLGIAALDRTLVGTDTQSPPAIQGSPAIFLVFERATQGTLMEFLKRHLDVPFFHSWRETLHAISQIGLGIDSLHQHNVIHRDIHPNNVLVSHVISKNSDGTQNVYYKYLISDIGEGKILRADKEFNDTSSGGESYSASEFCAMEITGEQGYSTKADVLSFAVLACRVLQCRDSVCTEQRTKLPMVVDQHESIDGTSTHKLSRFTLVVPVPLKGLIEKCFSGPPELRPSMQDALVALDEISSQLFSGKMEFQWVVWNWKTAYDIRQRKV